MMAAVISGDMARSGGVREQFNAKFLPVIKLYYLFV